MSSFVFYLPSTTPTPAPTTVPSGSVDHVSTAVAQLREVFKKTSIIQLLTALMNPVASFETAAWDVYTKRTIDLAFGSTLDAIGKIVGEPRNGAVDDTYRRYIRARIATNRSGTVPENLITIARLVINDAAVTFRYENIGIAAYILHAIGAVPDSVAAIVAAFLKEGTAGGVNGQFHWSSAVPALTFSFAKTTFPTVPIVAGDTSITVVSTAGFPSSGTLYIERGTTNEDGGVNYTGTTPTKFLGVTGIAHNHVVEAAVQPATDFNGFSSGVGMTDGGSFSGVI